VQEKIYLLTLKVTEEMIELQGAIAENIQENIHTESSDVLEVLDSLQKIMPESIEIRS
jgi:phosphoribosyl-ATP pyrophosphohydrolase